MSRTVDIDNKDTFRATIHQLKRLRGELDKPTGTTFTEALAKAASGHGTSIGSRIIGTAIGPGNSREAGTAAPVYRGTVDAASTFTEAGEKAIAAAKSSLDAVISDLEHLVSGLSDIDTHGASAVTKEAAS